MKQTTPEHKLRVSMRSFHWMHWLVLGLSLVLTLFAWRFTSSQHEAQVRRQFEREAEQSIRLVQERMVHYEDALWGGAAMFHSVGGDATYDQWLQYANSLRIDLKYPGINGIGFIESVDKAEIPAYLAKQRERRPDFRVHPEHENPVSYPITYIEPVAANAAAVGLDVAFETNRLTAANKARDTGEAQVTGPIVLVQDADRTPGFLFYVPFYREPESQLRTPQQRKATFHGLVYAPFVFKKLMAGTLHKQNRQVNIRIMDDGEPLFDELNGSQSDFDPDPLIKKSVTVELYGRAWAFDIWSGHSFRRANYSAQPQTILFGGITIDVLLLVLFTALSRARGRAEFHANELRIKAANLEETNHELEQMALTVEERTRHLEAANRQMSESQATVRTVIDASRNFLGLATPDGRIVEANQTFVGLASDSGEDVVGQFVWAAPGWAHAAELNARLKVGVQKAAAGGSDRFEISYRATDGSEIDLDFALNAVILNGKVVYVVIEGENVSKRREHEAQLDSYTVRLKKSNQDLEDFAYVASHDLRSPLRAISQLASWIKEDEAERMSPDGIEHLDKLFNRVSRMQQLLDDLLAYSRVGATGALIESVDTGKLIQELVGFLDTKGFVIEHPPVMPSVTSYRAALRLVFQNLIGNAIKHHDRQDGTIRIGFSESASEVEFSVSDDGPGIAPEYHEKVFELFQTLRRRDEVEGSGMGLAIVKRTLANLGGTIRLTSVPGEGTCFMFTCPKLADGGESTV